MHIDLDRAIELIDAAIAEKGADYVYAPDEEGVRNVQCRYFEKDGTPGCIVGTAYALAFPDLNYAEKVELEGLGPSGLPRWTHDMAYDADIFLTEVQSHQDCGDRWETAKEKALRTVLGDQEYEGNDIHGA